MLEIKETTKQRLEQYPRLKRCVEDFIKYDGSSPDPCCIASLTYYIKCMDLEMIIDVPEFFGWDEETAEDFYSWGHNSRYANVLEPMLYYELDNYVNAVMDVLDNLSGDKEWFFEKEFTTV